MHTADKTCISKIIDRVKWSLKYKEAMDLVELWVLLKTQYKEHHYNKRRLTQLQRQSTQITYKVNETDIIIGLLSEYSGNKAAKKQAEALSIKYRNKIVDALE